MGKREGALKKVYCPNLMGSFNFKQGHWRIFFIFV